MAKQQRRDLNREAFWRGVMKRFGKSGLTARAFCAGEQLSEPSFYAWRRMLPQRDAERAARAFVPVVVTDAVQAQAHAGANIEIEVRGDGGAPWTCVVRLPLALPMRQVAELVSAIAAAQAPGSRPAAEAEVRA